MQPILQHGLVVHELQAKISTQKNKKPIYYLYKPILASGLAILLSVILSLSLISNYQSENVEKPDENTFSILEHSNVELKMKIEYGEGENQIGFTSHGGEGAIGSSATSFDVKDGTFYILDNVNDKVLITGNGKQRTIPINDAWDLTDIIITENNEIYVLDSESRLVYQYSQSGELVDTHNVSDAIKIPTGLGFPEGHGVTVNQNNTVLISLKTGVRIKEENQPHKALRVNDNEGKIRLVNEKTENEITIPFEHSFGGITIHSVTNNQIVFTKGEIATNEGPIKGEFHVYIINKKGETQGAVRIPDKKTVMAPYHPIKTREEKIYFLSPEAEYLGIYELKAGKTFEKLLEQQIEEE
ncbi:NHL repeat-containing protein [Litchfieldia alkalitelluris]|uniref:hypothetical protein n=1 Tax=Litchfieldia alkalitelluris TaxID=304268 RepID=UPI0009981027|nr:hypothetical protein [Litchfieldia alkalitelluris]